MLPFGYRSYDQLTLATAGLFVKPLSAVQRPHKETGNKGKQNYEQAV